LIDQLDIVAVYQMTNPKQCNHPVHISCWLPCLEGIRKRCPVIELSCFYTSAALSWNLLRTCLVLLVIWSAVSVRSRRHRWH